MMESKQMNQLRELAAMRASILRGQTEQTYEMVDAKIVLDSVDDSLFQYADLVEFHGFKHDEALDFMIKASNNKQISYGPYDSFYYYEAICQARIIAHEINARISRIDSRQFIIKFGKYHCFQSIQIIIRDAINVISTMRSCNYEDNLFMDIYISYQLGELIRKIIGINFNVNKINIIMNIGSLHIFK